MLKKQKQFYYGGDYTPEQWDESVWQEDMRLYLVGLTYNQMRKRMSSQL
ncbi:hypothetical protein [Heyndrickxia ginsengihumi]|nr:hypothetical protein [Heyndrickxia ginsengihumi]MCM3023214.1 hypothetical protein [Heyndrickxia ginsengihumi]